MVLVTYDVSTESEDGKRRLRRIAKACQDYGQRVQYSVFEIEVEPGDWVLLKNRLEGEMDDAVDSLRYYFLGSNWQRRVEHVGAKAATDFHDTLIM